MARLALFLSFLSIIALISTVECRFVSSFSEEESVLVSDGAKEGSSYEILSLDPPNRVSKNACVHVYGFLPCADNFGGYVFQVFSFCCLLIIGENFLSEGRTKLFVIFEVGFYGGIVFPLLTMFTRIALILSSGLTGSREIANSMVDNNVGVTVAYTVFALTMQWGACVVFGLSGLGSDQSIRKGEVQRISSDTTIPRRQQIMKIVAASVKADPKNKKAAGIMLLTLLPFVMVTLSEVFDSKSWKDRIVLITLIISGSATVVYFLYSYFDTADQEKSLDHARFELMSEVHKHLQKFSPQRFIKNGQLSKESLHRLFEKIDVNKDGKIQVSELKDLTVEFGMLGRMKCDIHELATTLLADFDSDSDGEIDETEFEKGISRWLKQYKFSFDSTECQRDNRSEDRVLKMEQPKESLVAKLLSQRTMRATIEVILGILIVLFLATPFMMNIELLSKSAGVPSFYVVFVVIPLARNLRNALSAHFCRKKDKARVTSDTFSEIYKDVTMNNLLGISIILAIVYTRGLTWDYNTEVLIIVIVGLIIGVPAYVRSTYPFWICVLAFALYFFSLVLVYLHFNSLGKKATFTSNI
ncbi:sodium/calcium exchanger NCL isoform X2 [Raphanus sativus]|uniref:Sodium/calcium exchanger NCL isoform X2 n=1 Tax=Raphanus sativus TaxID=3726 RepID=A0A6J0MF18_RAPSA|nr:sodium/calcium exchanger NCL isoform X2 [Raphanus sativus]